MLDSVARKERSITGKVTWYRGNKTTKRPQSATLPKKPGEQKDTGNRNLDIQQQTSQEADTLGEKDGRHHRVPGEGGRECRG